MFACVRACVRAFAMACVSERVCECMFVRACVCVGMCACVCIRAYVCGFPYVCACVCLPFVSVCGQEPMRAEGPKERPTAVLCAQLSARYFQIRQTAKIRNTTP